MLNQTTYNMSQEYDSLKKVGVCVGMLCGAPVYRKFNTDDVTKYNSFFSGLGQFSKLAKTVKAGPQPANQMGSLRL